MLHDVAGLKQAEPRKVACGSAHSLLLLRAEGDQDAEERTQVLGWGNNRHNPLGLRRGDKQDSSEKANGIFELTTRVFEEGEVGKRKTQASRQVVEVACGSNHSAILEVLEPVSAANAEQPIIVKSRLLTCGNGANGQLGHEETSKDDDLPQPAEVKFPVQKGCQLIVQRVCCGADHTFAIVNISCASFTEAGRLFAWGLGSYGALGIGSWADCHTPTEVWFPEDDAEAHRRLTFVYQVAAGTKHSVALTDKGQVYTWGHGGHGRLGLGQAKVRGQNSYSAEFVPRQVSNLHGVKVTYIAAGEAHTAAVDQLGGLFTWGQGSYGRCGHGVGTDMPSPARVESLSGLSMSQVALGLMHSVTKSVKGQLYSWGKGPATGFDVADVITTPRQVKLDLRDPVYQIAAGPLHTVVLMQNGSVIYFGSGTEGRLPYRNNLDGSLEDVPAPTLLKPPELKVKGWAQEKNTKTWQRNREASWWPSRLCCGSSSSAVLTGTGEVPPGGMAMENLWLWGQKEISGVGDISELVEMMDEDPENTILDTNGDCWLPVPLKTGVRCRTVRMVAMGYEHCLIVTADSLMYAWGNGSKGQLGTGSMQAADTPQFITYPTDVLDVAAGEEHSACLIEGGECFTWGNAVGGRLGLGSCLTDGEQLSPKRVVIDQTELRVLRSVACGSQHSALITQDGRLLTFGTGWFGRLGNGEKDNEYMPKLVDLASQVKEVHCATYHTCIVDSSDRLWVCGRDSSLCRDGQNHVYRPILFEPFNQPGAARGVRSLATVEQHTLVAAYPMSKPETVELWVWGKNDRGQLGLPPSAAPVIDLPWQLKIPQLEEMQESGSIELDIVQVATGIHHSMCLAVTTDTKNNRQPLVYAWGSSGSGRLGFEPDELDKLQMLQIREMNKGKVPERTQMTGPKHLRIYPPIKVANRWRKGQKDAGHHVVAEKPQSIDKESRKWMDCQQKLFEESPDFKTKALQDQEKKAEKTCKSQLDFIRHLWEKPTSRTDLTEYTLRQLRKEIEVEYVRTLHALNMSGSGDGPQMEKLMWVKTDVDIKKKLLKFEELLWILQQQPLYMARLSAALRKNNVQDSEHQIFRKMCQRIFHDLFQPRTLHLCKSTLQLIAQSEVEQARNISELFHPAKSHATFLITQLATHAAFVDGIAFPILNPEDETSLVSMIIKYTMMKKDGESPRIAGTSEQDLNVVTGVFVTHWFEYQELVQKAFADRPAPPGSEKNRYLNFQTELLAFQRSCVEDSRSSEREKDVYAGCIPKFIRNFVRQIFEDERAKDFKMLLVSCFKALRASPAAKGIEQSDPKFCTPIASIVLANILASVLEAAQTPHFSLVVLKIRKKVFESHMNRMKNAGKNDGDFDPLDVAELLVERVLYNIQALAKVFQRTVHKQVFQTQFQTKPDQVLKEEPESRQICDEIKDFTCQILHEQFSQIRAGGWSEEAQDPIAAELATDLYMSHFTLQNTMVSMSALDLLNMANVLFRHKKDMYPNDTQDQLSEVLDDLMHRRPLEKPRTEHGQLVTEELSEYHPHGHLWLASQHGEWHNFRLKARFMEYLHGPDDQPMLCHHSQAPIPGRLAMEHQRSLSRQGEVHLVKKYTIPDEEKSMLPLMTLAGLPEPVEVYEHLEEIIQELSGNKRENDDVKYQITGQNWIDLRTGFSKIQKALQQDIKDGNASSKMRGLVMDLEEGKKIIDEVMQAKRLEVEFMKYIDRSVQRRYVHARYLESASQRDKLIFKCRESYLSDLKEHVETLQEVLKVSTDCTCPSRFTMAAAQRSEKISFLRLRRIKQRIRKTKPTPGQKIMDTMGTDDSRDAGKLQELKESIIPTQTFSLGQLESKGVVVRMHEKLPGKTRKHMSFTFQTCGEGFNVQIFLKTTLLKEFEISREQIEDMEMANKTSAASFAEDFVWMNGYRLRRLLTFIVVDNGV